MTYQQDDFFCLLMTLCICLVLAVILFLVHRSERRIKPPALPQQMTPDNEIRRQTIDQLYQTILAKKIQFPGDIREIFHEHMNRLTASPIYEKDGKHFQEIQVPWAEATAEERARWASYNQGHIKRMIEVKKEDLP